MAKEGEKKESVDRLVPKHVQAIYSKDLSDMQGFIVQEFIKSIQQEYNGKIPPVNDKGLQEQIDSLLNADPEALGNKGKPVLSLKNTEVGIFAAVERSIKKEPIEKLTKELTPKLTEEFTEALRKEKPDISKEDLEREVKEKIKEHVKKLVDKELEPEVKAAKELMDKDFFKPVRDSFAAKLSTDKGIQELVSKRVVEQLIRNNANFSVIDKETNKGRFDKKTNKGRFLTPDEKNNFAKSLAEQITLTPEMLQTLLDPKKVEEQKLIKETIYDRAAECFVETDKKTGLPLINKETGLPSLDQEKLDNPAKLKMFGEMAEDCIKYPNAAKNLSNELVSNFEKTGAIISDKTKGKFDTLSKKLARRVGPGYIEKNLAKTVKFMAEEINKQKTVFSKWRGVGGDLKVATSQLDEIIYKVEKKIRSEAKLAESKRSSQEPEFTVQAKDDLSNVVIIDGYQDKMAGAVKVLKEANLVSAPSPKDNLSLDGIKEKLAHAKDAPSQQQAITTPKKSQQQATKSDIGRG